MSFPVNQQKEDKEELPKVNLQSKQIQDINNIFQDILNSCPNVYELDLSDNLLTALPSNLTGFNNLQIIDLQKNPFKDYYLVIDALSSLPSLINLKLDLMEEHLSLLLGKLPNLQILNGKSTKGESLAIDLEDPETNNISLDNEKPLFTEIFATVSEKLNKINKEYSESFLHNFEDLLKNEINKINSCVEVNSPNYIYATHVIDSVLTILDYFNVNYYKYLETKDQESITILKKINNHFHLTTKKLIDIIFKLYPKIEDKTCRSKYNYSEDGKCSYMNNNIEYKIQEITKEKEMLAKRYDEEIRIYKTQIETLERENKQMTSMLITNAKSIIKNNNSSSGLSIGMQSSSSNNQQLQQQILMKKGKSNYSLNGNQGNQTFSPSSRIFTIKMMKDTINDLYNSKVEHNKKCEESKMARETMEQHMYTFLNYKFGLKSIIIEWATNIINGIRAFSIEDSEICLFGKILRNELEEDARLFLPMLKSKINELLMFYLRQKYSFKSMGDINEMQQKIINSSMTEEEWQRIIFNLYDEADSKYLEKRILEVISKNLMNSKGLLETTKPNKKMTREEIMMLEQQKEDNAINYKDFVNVLHDFQIKSREKYLKHFNQLFRKVDLDNNGILNEEEFITLVSSFQIYSNDVFEDNIKKILAMIDPYNYKTITYSECILLFSQIPINIENKENDKGTITILDKICLDITE